MRRRYPRVQVQVDLDVFVVRAALSVALIARHGRKVNPESCLCIRLHLAVEIEAGVIAAFRLLCEATHMDV